jgi:hypothetical protein
MSWIFSLPKRYQCCWIRLRPRLTDPLHNHHRHEQTCTSGQRYARLHSLRQSWRTHQPCRRRPQVGRNAARLDRSRLGVHCTGALLGGTQLFLRARENEVGRPELLGKHVELLGLPPSFEIVGGLPSLAVSHPVSLSGGNAVVVATWRSQLPEDDLDIGAVVRGAGIQESYSSGRLISD